MTIYNDNMRYKEKKWQDSLIPTYKKSLKLAKLISDDSRSVNESLKFALISNINIHIGIHYLELGNEKDGKIAIKYLLEAYNIHQNSKYDISPYSKILLLNQLSWFYLMEEEYQKSINFSVRALNLEKKYKSPHYRVESYEFLSNCYLELGDTETAQTYSLKYRYLKDSLNRVKMNDADTTMKKWLLR